MARTDLHVPFEEKGEVKRLGARWDATNRLWYVPPGVEPGPFKRWLPAEPDINVRAKYYLIAESAKACWKCSQSTRVFGILLPAGHQTLEPVDEEQFILSGETNYKAWCASPASSH